MRTESMRFRFVGGPLHNTIQTVDAEQIATNIDALYEGVPVARYELRELFSTFETAYFEYHVIWERDR